MEFATSRRIDQLTGLRFFAALLVFLSHLKWEKTGQFLQRLFDQGYVGVSFFFVLSGFVLSLSYSERLKGGNLSRAAYILFRYARLTPLHILTASPFLILALREGVFNPIVSIANLLYLQSWIPSSFYYFSLNAPSWSLSDEIFFYFSFLGLILLNKQNKLRLALLMSAIVFLVACYVERFHSGHVFFGAQTFSHWLFYIFPGFRLLEFIVGMIIYDFWARNYFKRAYFSSLAIPTLLLAMYFGRLVPESIRMSLYYLPFVIFLLISHLGEEKTPSNKLFSMPLMVLLGEASFAFYLIHQPIILVAREMAPALAQNELLFFLAMVVFISLSSVLLFWFYERPFESFLKNQVRKLKI